MAECKLSTIMGNFCSQFLASLDKCATELNIVSTNEEKKAVISRWVSPAQALVSSVSSMLRYTRSPKKTKFQVVTASLS